MDAEFGPDGALYVLDYGTGYFNGDANSALYRIEYIGDGNRAPTAKAAATTTSGQAPLTVGFSSAGSTDPEGTALKYRWDFGDGTSSTDANPSHTYTTNGVRTATLTVTDGGGKTGSANVTVTVGNTAPTVRIDAPLDGKVFAYGDTIPYRITVTDPEDGTIDCNRVKMTYGVGHDSHGHVITTRTGCTGSITIPVDGEHDEAANVFGSWDAEYTDNGANGQPALTTHAKATTQPRHRQAEHFESSAGVDKFAKSQAEGGYTVGNVNNGDWIAFTPYALGNATSFTARVSSGGSGGTIQVRAGSPTGAVLGSATVANTGGWETFTTVTGTLAGAPAGTTKLYFTFAGGSGALFDVDSFTFTTTAAAAAQGQIVGNGGKCVDVANRATANGTAVRMWDCNGTPAQDWTRSGETWRALGKCLDVKSAGTAADTQVWLWDCNTTVAQNWVPGANGSLVNPNSGKCLDGVYGTDRLVIRACDGSATQNWITP